jgi:hypothetical protein
MKGLQQIFDLLMSVLSGIALYLTIALSMPLLDPEFSAIFWGYLLTLFLPSLLIDLIFGLVGRGLEKDVPSECGGLRYGGSLIGFAERSLIFLAVTIAYFDNTLTYTSILSFLSVIVAGKAIFRYSGKDTSNRACADWYILGTLMSITMGLALTWGIFRFLLIG